MPVYYASIFLIPAAIILGIFGLILETPLIVYFVSSVLFRAIVVILSSVLTFASVLVPLFLGRRKISKMRTTEQIRPFVQNRRGNVTNSWDEVESAVLHASSLTLYFANNHGLNAELRQIYYPQDQAAAPTLDPRSFSPIDSENGHSDDNDALSTTEQLQRFLSRKLGNRLAATNLGNQLPLPATYSLAEVKKWTPEGPTPEAKAKQVEMRHAGKEKPSAKIIRRSEILVLAGSGFLFAASYLLYDILEYIRAENGVNTLPSGAIFAFPEELALLYYLTLAVGCCAIGIGRALLSPWFRKTSQSVREFPASSVRTMKSILPGLFFVDFLGPFLYVYLERFNYYLPPLAIRNSLEWQLGTAGLFAGLA